MSRSHRSVRRSVRRFDRLTAAALAVLLAATLPVDSVDAGGARRDDSRRTAGAPDYLHFGRQGLCAARFDPHVGDGEIGTRNGVLYINGTSDGETLVELTIDDRNTTSAWDDELVVQMSTFAKGPDIVVEERYPYWQPATGGGPIGGITTVNTPKRRTFGYAYFAGSSSVRNSVQNDTALPMRADGWFALLASDDDGFDGGSGPDCVKGSNNDDRIFTRAGSDYVRGKYGDDLIITGADPDTVDAGADDDTIRGGGGNDHLSGEHGSDCYDGGTGHDLLDDQHPSSTQIDQYETDDVYDDTITAAWPQMVDDCM